MPVVQPSAAGRGGSAKGPFAITPGVSLWTLVIFLMLLVVLAKTAWPMILKAVEEREAKIRSQIEAAERANAEAQRMLQEYQGQLAAREGRGAGAGGAGRQAGEQLREEIAARARAEHEDSNYNSNDHT